MDEQVESIADEITEEAASDVTSPVSGVSEALTAGASLLSTASHWRARRIRRVVKIELPAYLLVQCS